MSGAYLFLMFIVFVVPAASFLFPYPSLHRNYLCWYGVDSAVCLLDKGPRLSWGRLRFPGSKVFLIAFFRPWRPTLAYISRSLIKIARESELAFDPAHFSFSEHLLCCFSVTQIPESGLCMAVQIHHLHLRRLLTKYSTVQNKISSVHSTHCYLKSYYSLSSVNVTMYLFESGIIFIGIKL